MSWRTDDIHQLAWYNAGNALWGIAYSIQQLLVVWILVGILAESPERVGVAQMLIGLPGLVFMLWGGAIGDSANARQLLVRVHYLSALPPLTLAAVYAFGLLSFWPLIVIALAVGLLNSSSNPTRQSILSRIAGSNLQLAISLSTGIGALASMAGAKLGGEVESLGIVSVLMIQAFLFVAGGLVTSRLHAGGPDGPRPSGTAATRIRVGLAHLWQHRLARDIVALNCFSSFFNAGAWMTAIPFIVITVYDGAALQLANITVIFYTGSLVATFGLLRYMPLRRPGRLYLIMQLSRVLVLLLIWCKPPIWALWIAAAYWGFNMGITTTMSRVMVQEIASAEFRARVLSIYTLGQLSAMPIGSLILGFVIGIWGPLNALIPGMIASVVIFHLGFRATDIWKYRSPIEPI